MFHKKRKLEALEDGGIEGTCQLDHYALSLILDFTGIPFFRINSSFLIPCIKNVEPVGIDHPFRQVCKATREAWFEHPFSLPLRIKIELASKLPTHALIHEQEAALLQILQQSLGVLSQKVEKEQKRRKKEKTKLAEIEWRTGCIAAMIDSLRKSYI